MVPSDPFAGASLKALEVSAEQFQNEEWLEAASARVVRDKTTTGEPLRKTYADFPQQFPSGAELHLDNAIFVLHRLCQRTKECRRYNLAPVYDVTGGKGHKHQQGYVCHLTLQSLFGL